MTISITKYGSVSVRKPLQCLQTENIDKETISNNSLQEMSQSKAI